MQHVVCHTAFRSDKVSLEMKIVRKIHNSAWAERIKGPLKKAIEMIKHTACVVGINRLSVVLPTVLSETQAQKS